MSFYIIRCKKRTWGFIFSKVISECTLYPESDQKKRADCVLENGLPVSRGGQGVSDLTKRRLSLSVIKPLIQVNLRGVSGIMKYSQCCISIDRSQGVEKYAICLHIDVMIKQKIRQSVKLCLWVE